MDVYETSTAAADYFRIDDLLDLSNEKEPCSSSSTPTACHLAPPPSPSIPYFHSSAPYISPSISSDFTDHLFVPSDEVAELEWLSQFVEDSFSDFLPNSSLTGTINVQSQNASFSGRARTKLSKDTEVSLEADQPPPAATGRSRVKKEASPADGGGVRRCTHCASEKTPQWRTGPLGPKTLCNACGVRYKSGRLVPEYRPAASPTFVLTQHSNSHRKVMELRRQKEMLRQQRKHQQEQHIYHHDHHNHHHQQDFEVC